MAGTRKTLFIKEKHRKSSDFRRFSKQAIYLYGFVRNCAKLYELVRNFENLYELYEVVRTVRFVQPVQLLS
jgi:hypothetical protein